MHTINYTRRWRMWVLTRWTTMEVITCLKIGTYTKISATNREIESLIIIKKIEIFGGFEQQKSWERERESWGIRERAKNLGICCSDKGKGFKYPWSIVFTNQTFHTNSLTACVMWHGPVGPSVPPYLWKFSTYMAPHWLLVPLRSASRAMTHFTIHLGHPLPSIDFFYKESSRGMYVKRCASQTVWCIMVCVASPFCDTWAIFGSNSTRPCAIAPQGWVHDPSHLVRPMWCTWSSLCANFFHFGISASSHASYNACTHELKITPIPTWKKTNQRQKMHDI